jgi:hypothetical protein
LRVAAIDRALAGANFIEIFRFFLDSGMTEQEAVQSTTRVFRGGNPAGGSVFVKDGVYLRGLLQIHTFLHAALAEHQPRLAQALFLGRLTCSDVLELAPCLEEGFIIPPRFMPSWVTDQASLSAYLAFSWLTHSLPMEQARLADYGVQP